MGRKEGFMFFCLDRIMKNQILMDIKWPETGIRGRIYGKLTGRNIDSSH
jgi:hypothetical protein